MGRDDDVSWKWMAMTDDDRAYYRVRYIYAVRKAEESMDASVKAAHLVMAAQYRRHAALDDMDDAVAAKRSIDADADTIGHG